MVTNEEIMKPERQPDFVINRDIGVTAKFWIKEKVAWDYAAEMCHIHEDKLGALCGKNADGECIGSFTHTVQEAYKNYLADTVLLGVDDEIRT